MRNYSIDSENKPQSGYPQIKELNFPTEQFTFE